MNTQKIMLDFCENNFKTVVFKQYDKNSRNLNITCTSNGSVYKLNYSEHSCKVKMLTPNGRPLYKSATILEDGTVFITFDDDMLYESGTGQLEIQIIDVANDSNISTMILTVVIIGSVYLDDVVIASEEFSALVDALNKLEAHTSFNGDVISNGEPTTSSDLSFWMQEY